MPELDPENDVIELTCRVIRPNTEGGEEIVYHEQRMIYPAPKVDKEFFIGRLNSLAFFNDVKVLCEAE